jgi:hypothetical protein
MVNYYKSSLGIKTYCAFYKRFRISILIKSGQKYCLDSGQTVRKGEEDVTVRKSRQVYCACVAGSGSARPAAAACYPYLPSEQVTSLLFLRIFDNYRPRGNTC